MKKRELHEMVIRRNAAIDLLIGELIHCVNREAMDPMWRAATHARFKAVLIDVKEILS